MRIPIAVGDLWIIPFDGSLCAPLCVGIAAYAGGQWMSCPMAQACSQAQAYLGRGTPSFHHASAAKKKGRVRVRTGNGMGLLSHS